VRWNEGLISGAPNKGATAFSRITTAQLLPSSPACWREAPTAFPQAAAFARSASAHPLKPPHCAHAQGQSRVPMCRTVLEEHAAPAARGMQTETPPKQAAWRGKCGKG